MFAATRCASTSLHARAQPLASLRPRSAVGGNSFSSTPRAVIWVQRRRGEEGAPDEGRLARPGPVRHHRRRRGVRLPPCPRHRSRPAGEARDGRRPGRGVSSLSLSHSAAVPNARLAHRRVRRGTAAGLSQQHPIRILETSACRGAHR